MSIDRKSKQSLKKIDVAQRNKSKRTANKRKVSVKSKKSRFSLKDCINSLRWLVIFSGAISCLVAVVYYGGVVVTKFMNRPIAEIIVKGNFDYVDRGRVSHYMQGMIGRSFIGESINTVRQDVKAMVWVDRVSLSRQWPEKLIVTIEEQKPIARWGEQGFVNVRGELIITNQLNNIAHLPELNDESLHKAKSQVGHTEQDQVLGVMQQYQEIAQVLSKHDMSIKRLSRNKRDAWQLELMNGWQVILGRGDLLKKVERLTYLFERQLLENIAVIDVRYNNGVSIKHTADKDLVEVGTEVIYQSVAETSSDNITGNMKLNDAKHKAQRRG